MPARLAVLLTAVLVAESIVLVFVPSLRSLLAVYVVFSVALLAALGARVWASHAAQARDVGERPFRQQATGGTTDCLNCASSRKPG